MTRKPPSSLRLAATVLALALGLLVQGSPVSSAAHQVFTVEPSDEDGPGARPWFVYSLQPGQIFRDTVSISNHSDEPLFLVLYATDGFTIPGSGGFAPGREGEEPTGAGTWVTLPVESITIEPGIRADIPFLFEVPIDAEPGDHAAAIVASDPEGSEVDGDSAINISVRNRVGARIYVRVAGPLEPSLRVDDITVVHNRPLNPVAEGTATIRYTISNTGNVRLSPDFQVKVNGLFGRNLVTLPPRHFPDVLPDGVIIVTEVVDGLNAWEPLSAEVLAVSPEFSTSRSTTFYPIPWPTVLLILLAVGLFIAWIWVRRRGRNEPDATPAAPEDGPQDTERELAEAGV